jgi:hypothetical protein
MITHADPRCALACAAFDAAIAAAIGGVTDRRALVDVARGAIALGAPLLAPGVEDRILNFVAGGGDDAVEITIAPALLSLALRELNERRLTRGPDAKITPDLLDVEQQTIFEDFYNRTLQDFPAGVRVFIEDTLLTTTGYRDSCALDDALSCQDVMLSILNELVNRRLLAYEDRHHTRRVELSHDVLIPVIKVSRDNRHAREALAQAERQQLEAAEKARVARRRLAVVAVLLVFAVAAAIYGFREASLAESTRAQADVDVTCVSSKETPLLIPNPRHLAQALRTLPKAPLPRQYLVSLFRNRNWFLTLTEALRHEAAVIAVSFRWTDRAWSSRRLTIRCGFGTRTPAIRWENRCVMRTALLQSASAQTARALSPHRLKRRGSGTKTGKR